MDNKLMALVNIKPEYDFSVDETIFVNGREARGYGVITEVSWDKPLKPVDENPPNENGGRPMPPHIRVKMNGVNSPKSGSGKFLFHQDDIIANKLVKLSEIDFQ